MLKKLKDMTLLELWEFLKKESKNVNKKTTRN